MLLPKRPAGIARSGQLAVEGRKRMPDVDAMMARPASVRGFAVKLR
jgi:hypothetical protein